MPTPPPLPSDALRPGMALDHGRYRLERVLGAGGNGVVWLATHSAMNSEVVLKFPRFSHAKSAEDLQQELRLLAEFSNRHPHVANILDTGSYNGAPYLVMQYLRNGSLGEFCRGGARDHAGDATALRQSMDWLRSIADALDFLHRQKLVHRDVKPANILLDDSFAAYLADFGIASLGVNSNRPSAAPGVAVGSLPYMAPELLQGVPASAASDQFGLAVSLYEFVTGRLPFEAAGAGALLAQHHSFLPKWKATPPPPWPGGLWSVMDRALAMDPRRRFAVCSQFAQAFLGLWNGPQANPVRNAPRGGIVPATSGTTRRPPSLTSADAPPRLPRPPVPRSAPDSPQKLKLKHILDKPKETDSQ